MSFFWIYGSLLARILVDKRPVAPDVCPRFDVCKLPGVCKGKSAFQDARLGTTCHTLGLQCFCEPWKHVEI